MNRARSAPVLFAVALLLAACARTPVPEPPVPAARSAQDSAARADSLAQALAAAGTRIRHAVYPVPTTNAFLAGVRNRTRTLDGRPGPGYWQQRVNYRIEAEIDPGTARVQGEETIVYENNSPDTLHTIMFHLYQNAFAPGVQRVRRVPITGGMTLESVKVGGIAARTGGRGAGPGYRIDGTVMSLELPAPLLPGGRIQLDLAWHFIVPPRGAPRTGHDDKQVFVVAQWYPQIATYDDVNGWDARPYWTNGEFYLEYGDFDVSITAPENWLVTGSGELQNPEEVLTEETRKNLSRALTSDDIIHVVTADDIASNAATQREPGGMLTWRFVARHVRDFAFATSNRYLWDATRAVLPDADADGRDEVVAVNAFYRASATAWTEAARYMRHAVTFHARHWHPYIYPRISAAEGPIGGMEYPMLVFIGAPTEPIDLYAVLAHEIGHQWWAMMVGSNEPVYAWQDEGLNTYTEDLAVKDYFPNADPFEATADAYLSIAGSDVERPSMREADLYGPGPQYAVATYRKPGTIFRALAGVIGTDRLQAALRVYTSRWLLKHPTPWDLFHTIEDVAGRDLDWFWTPWFFETVTLDQAVVSVSDVAAADSTHRITVVIEDQGEAPMPVELAVTLANGETRHVTLPVDPWLAGATRQAADITAPVAVTRVEIDPGRMFPDTDRHDNVWSGAGGG